MDTVKYVSLKYTVVEGVSKEGSRKMGYALIVFHTMNFFLTLCACSVILSKVHTKWYSLKFHHLFILGIFLIGGKMYPVIKKFYSIGKLKTMVIPITEQ